MSVKGVEITKAAPSTGGATTSDAISGMVLNGVAVAGKLELGKVYRLESIRDANALGLDDAYDTTNSVLVYYHIKEFYYESEGKGRPRTPLYILVVAQSVTLPVMVEDTTGIYGKKLLIEAKGTVKQLAFAYNPSAYSPTQLNGLDADVVTAIAKAQLLADWAWGQIMPCQILLEGKSFSGPVSSAGDLRALPGVVAPKVTVVIGQDHDVAKKATLFNKHAAVGTFLGDVAARSVNENPAWVEVGNMADTARGRWLNPALSSHQLIDVYKADWQSLDDKGYVFPQTYANIDGVYWNNDHTCCAIIEDSEGNISESNVHYGRTADKASRVLYAALIRSVKSPQPVNPSTGKLPIGIVAYFKGLTQDRIDREMGNTNEISGREVWIDPDSDLITAKTLNAGVKIVPYGSADTIKVNLSLNSRV